MISAMGPVLAAGNNTKGQLGDGTMAALNRPDYAHIISNAVFMTAVAAGSNHVLAVNIDGSVWAWGNNDHGQLGDDTVDDRPWAAAVREPGITQGDVIVRYQPIDRVIAAAAGPHHSLGLLANGTVLAWGANDRGQLGDGTTADRHLPVLVLSPLGTGLLSDIIAIAAGNASSVALRADGTVWTWGSNENGELGDGTREDRHFPVQVPVTRIVAVAARGTHMLALVVMGACAHGGTNSHGELGDNTATARVSPVQVKGPPPLVP